MTNRTLLNNVKVTLEVSENDREWRIEGDLDTATIECRPPDEYSFGSMDVFRYDEPITLEGVFAGGYTLTEVLPVTYEVSHQAKTTAKGATLADLEAARVAVGAPVDAAVSVKSWELEEIRFDTKTEVTFQWTTQTT